MFRFAILFLLFCAPVWAAPAPDLTPQKGEIALEGQITKFDVVRNTFQLNATAFTPFGGARKPLPAPKLKSIALTEDAIFWDLAKNRRLSLGDLENGLAVTVVGRELGGEKPFAARLIAWKMAAPELLPDPITPAAVAPLLPPPQTKGSVTLRVIDAGFKPLNQLWPRTEPSPRPTYFFTYRVSSPDNAPSYSGMSLIESQTQLLRIEGPNGERVQRQMGGPFETAPGQFRGTVNALQDLDPRWKSVTAFWETLDPAAPPSAKGEIVSEIVLDKVPVPEKAGQELKITREIATALGTTIQLESVKWEAPDAKNETGTTWFQLRSRPTNQVPDLRVSLDISGVKTGEGVPWSYNSWGSSDDLLRVKAVPPANSRFLNLTVEVTQSAQTLQKREWYRQFQAEIPVAALLKIAPPIVNPEPTVVASATTENVAVEVEAGKPNDKAWLGLLWLQNRAPDAKMSWLVRAIKARGDGTEWKAESYPTDYGHEFWRASGEMAATDAKSLPIWVNFGDKKPKNFELELQLEAARRQENWSWLRQIPVPLPDQTIEVKEGQLENDYLRIRRIFWVRNGQELKGLPEDRRRWYSRPGLAIVVELLPIFPDAEAEIVGYSVLNSANGSSSFATSTMRGDASQAGTQNTRLRTLFETPPRGAQSLDIWFNTVESKASGQTETVVLKDIQPNFSLK